MQENTDTHDTHFDCAQTSRKHARRVSSSIGQKRRKLNVDTGGSQHKRRFGLVIGRDAYNTVDFFNNNKFQW